MYYISMTSDFIFDCFTITMHKTNLIIFQNTNIAIIALSYKAINSKVSLLQNQGIINEDWLCSATGMSCVLNGNTVTTLFV